MAALVAGQALAGFARAEALLRLRLRVDLSLMTSFLGHLFRLPYAYFQLRDSGDVLTRATSGLVIREALSSHTLSLLLDTATAAFHITLLWLLDPRVGAVALAPIASLARVYHSLQSAAVHVRRLQDVFEERPEPGGATAPPLRGRISLRGVSYRYRGDTDDAVSGVDLEIPEGSMVAVMGPSGSGKSTLGRLMLGLYPARHGRILFDGIPLDGLDSRTVRSQCGVVVQDDAVFSGSVLDNIRINAPNAGVEEVVRAARAACLHEDVERMPLGYLTPLGERGGGLSGGQRQRLGLARALVSDPRILLLDEATSHLDTATEERVQRNLREMDRTRVVVAHRLSTVRDADLTVVVSGGLVLERGTHGELLALGGVYTDLTGGELSETSVN